MKYLDFKNKWVLITGASSGLGEELAWQLARIYEAKLVLVARRRERLEKLKWALESETGVDVRVEVVDLSQPEAIDPLLRRLMKEVPLYAVILNAGITYLGKHLELPKEQFDQIIRTNIISVSYMTDIVARYFEETQQEGGLMLVSSMAALFPTPYQAAYAGTKAFLLNFASALTQELTNKHFSITVFLPGGIATEMTAGEKFNELRGYLMPVQQVAKEGILAFRKRKLTYIPGFLNRISTKFAFLLRKEFIIKQTGKTYRKSLDKLN